jgi:hypothetical protein
MEMQQKQDASKPTLETSIDDLYVVLKTYDIDSPEYRAALDALVVLNKIKADFQPDRVSKDTWVIAGSNLLGIGAIVFHERAAVITSKALSLVLKPK